MKRVLKPTGSIYLHCDPTAGHYLKTMMDAVFGENNFKREVIWNLGTASGYKSQINGFIRGHDTILYYTKSTDTFVFNKIFQPHKPEYIKRFSKVDEQGRRYRDDRPNRRRQYLDETEGVALTDVWSDIMSFQQHSTSKERTGYPTQKPLALLERIIKASSNRDDIVLDPFCGCATTCIAAESLQRQWIGIDLSSKAVELVKVRLERDLNMTEDTGLLGDKVIHRTDIPTREVPDEPRQIHAATLFSVQDSEGMVLSEVELRQYKTYKHTLFGIQEGKCNGCEVLFPFRNMTIDHIFPRSRGGTNDPDNLQLLCAACNSTKSNRTQDDLIAALREQGVLR